MATSRKIHRGQVLDGLPAGDWNRFVDTSDRVDELGERGLLGRNRRTVRIENGTGEALTARFPVLGTDGALIDPAANESQWAEKMILAGVAPGRRRLRVLERVDAASAPPTTADGDRYLLDGASTVHSGWGGVEGNRIVERDGADWIEDKPHAGDIVFDLNRADDVPPRPDWRYDGASWTSQHAGEIEPSLLECAVLNKTAAAGEIVRGAIRGLARVKLRVRNDWHEYARPESTGLMRSSYAGHRIVWRETLTDDEVDGLPDTPADVWAIVDLSPFSAVLEGYLLEPMDGAYLDSGGEIVPGCARVAVYQHRWRGSPEWRRVGQLSVLNYSGQAAGASHHLSIVRKGSRWTPATVGGTLQNDGYEPGDVLDLTFGDDD